MRARPLAFVFLSVFAFVAHAQAQSAPSICKLLDALRKAFSQFPVTVERAAPHDSFWSCLKNWELPGCVGLQRINVSGVWPGDGSGGETTGIAALSFVYYWISLQNSQAALKKNPVYPPQTTEDIKALAQLLQAVGVGIGNSSAHELGHQFAYTFRINMDRNASGGTPCLKGDSNVFEPIGASSWQYNQVYPDIHWEVPDGVCAVQQYFDESYRN